MTIRSVTIAALLVAVAAPLALAQQRPPAAPAAAPFKVPRTADGRPDLQGYWTNLTYTPFERPKELADRPFYSPEEAVAVFSKAAGISLSTDQVVHYFAADFGATPVQTGAKPNLRTSLLVDPGDGRMPPLTPDAQKAVAERVAAEKANGRLPRSWRDDRGAVWCVFHDRAVPAIPAPYGSNYHIVQSKDWIVMTYEWNSERRVIPLDGRPHAPAAFRTYAGDSRGRWEGETLVVETINFAPNRTIFGSPGTPAEVSMSPAFKLIERFTRVSADTIVHTYTVEDPATWTRPWTVELPMHRINGPMLEYACNENNQDLFTTLKNARAEEQGKLAPPNATRRGDAKAIIEGHTESGNATVHGVEP
jgi:hypothetical protein